MALLSLFCLKEGDPRIGWHSKREGLNRYAAACDPL